MDFYEAQAKCHQTLCSWVGSVHETMFEGLGLSRL